MSRIENVSLDRIKADTRAQPRAAMLMDEIAQYMERMSEGDQFPPLVVFFDGDVHWLADGFHRYHAAKGLDVAEFACDIREGGLRDAVLYSVGANAAHGIKRTNEDKRRAVTRLLNDAEWAGWADREIARQCRVTHPFVAQIRATSLTGNVTSEPRTYVSKHGTTATMRTENIGAPPREWLNNPATWDRSGKYDERPLSRPVAPPSPRAAQIEKDRQNVGISFALWEIERNIRELPDDPAEAAREFPVSHRHTFTVEKLRTMAGWLNQFADEWGNLVNEGEFNVAAE